MITIISVRITKIPFFLLLTQLVQFIIRMTAKTQQIAQPPPVKVCCRSGGIPPLPFVGRGRWVGL